MLRRCRGYDPPDGDPASIQNMVPAKVQKSGRLRDTSIHHSIGICIQVLWNEFCHQGRTVCSDL